MTNFRRDVDTFLRSIASRKRYLVTRNPILFQKNFIENFATFTCNKETFPLYSLNDMTLSFAARETAFTAEQFCQARRVLSTQMRLFYRQLRERDPTSTLFAFVEYRVEICDRNFQANISCRGPAFRSTQHPACWRANKNMETLFRRDKSADASRLARSGRLQIVLGSERDIRLPGKNRQDSVPLTWFRLQRTVLIRWFPSFFFFILYSAARIYYYCGVARSIEVESWEMYAFQIESFKFGILYCKSALWTE